MRSCLYVFLTDLVFYATNHKGELMTEDRRVPAAFLRGTSRKSLKYEIFVFGSKPCTPKLVDLLNLHLFFYKMGKWHHQGRGRERK